MTEEPLKATYVREHASVAETQLRQPATSSGNVAKKNKDIDSAIIRDTQHLRHQAKDEIDQWPCFWLRALLPTQWVKNLLDKEPNTTKYIVTGIAEQPDAFRDKVFYIATDGSGGRYPATSQLRKVGWGVTFFDHLFRPVGTICGGIDGPWTQQTVPYAELVAFTEALGIAKQASELHFVIDADYVVKGWQNRAAWRKDKPHRAQW
jgi:hypothetical protein